MHDVVSVVVVGMPKTYSPIETCASYVIGPRCENKINLRRYYKLLFRSKVFTGTRAPDPCVWSSRRGPAGPGTEHGRHETRCGRSVFGVFNNARYRN